MASCISFEVIEDDDGFDWNAAVREIDVACEAKRSSSSSAAAASDATITTSAIPFPKSNMQMGSCPKTENNRPTSSRQSTLDRFIGLKSANQDARHDAQDNALCDDDRVSSVSIDHEAANTWIYPENVPIRDYQVSITRTALFSNTLVSLPTGLGKTLIAAVVMYNYFRWFPQGKIVFAAPSRPLVRQQIEACHNIVGISQEWTVDMTGQTSPSERVGLWKAKRIFFVTPQVLEKDIQSGSCVVKQLVCLVIDEAHRASGNYAYCVAVRELMAVPVQLRILALTATPGSNHQTVQQVIDNLQISSLEHRSESDPDVTPYVHDRNTELMKVEMGKDAVEVLNLLIDVSRSLAGRLNALGVLLPKRDVQTLSPPILLESREKYRQSLTHDPPHYKYADVEMNIRNLIALYNIRKRLTISGIGAALEMLEEKLTQGSFRALGSNETLWKAKTIMKENLSHGILSPKFPKMLEVLVEHFKTHDHQKSRVIIFTHFRGSVRDIMMSLATIGEHVRPAAFIGQSSGKTSKGQSQKVQQAVLESFRAGRYNVLVATSIGEEGLDIMEVDLVICFDSNVSPLRMIQRMGRTGRKNKGRVVCMAYEGSELKGYMQKQRSGKKIIKLLRNATNSFRFHSSPRMVPHVFKPEKMLVKLLIEEFVHRGKKVKDNDAIQTPKYKLKLTAVESDLLAKYFQPSRESNWRPSLIAFPHFQAFQSGVREVAHSMRTTMLIDTMQYLQELSYSNHSNSFIGQDKETLEGCFEVESIDLQKDNTITSEADVIRKEPKSDASSLMDTSRTQEKHDLPDARSRNVSIHSFLFCSDYMSVDCHGNVLILSVPSFPSKQVSPFKSSSPLKPSLEEYQEVPLDVHGVSSTPLTRQGNEDLELLSLRNADDLEMDKLGRDGRVFQMEICKLEVSNRELHTWQIPNAVVDDTHSCDDSSIDYKTGDLSPRLTNLYMSGVVPESPIDEGFAEMPNKAESDCMTRDPDMLLDTSISLVQSKTYDEANESTPNRRNCAASCFQGEIQTAEINIANRASEKCISASNFVGQIRTPLTSLSTNSRSKDWILSSGDKSISQPKQRLKRLRKLGDVNRGNLLREEATMDLASVSGKSLAGLNHASEQHRRGNEKLFNGGRVYIEDEAEVSSEASGDEEVDDGQDSYEGSFIDDRINPTVASTQAEGGERDMMAIYRRSLLSQSPITNFSGDVSPDNMVTINEGFSADFTIASTTRKRKFSVSQEEGGSLPIRNLETEMCKEALQKVEEESMDMDAFDNDDFYQGIDLDALEEEATKQLRSLKKPSNQSLVSFDPPSFDLGI